MFYKIQTVIVMSGMFSKAEENIASEVQPILDEGVKRGWKLHTFTPITSANSINICLVWEVH